MRPHATACATTARGGDVGGEVRSHANGRTRVENARALLHSRGVRAYISLRPHCRAHDSTQPARRMRDEHGELVAALRTLSLRSGAYSAHGARDGCVVTVGGRWIRFAGVEPTTHRYTTNADVDVDVDLMMSHCVSTATIVARLRAGMLTTVTAVRGAMGASVCVRAPAETSVR